MNPIKTAVAGLATVAASLALAAPAAAASTTNCHGRQAFQWINSDIHDADHTGDLIHVSWKVRPECAADTWVTVATHDTAQLQWDPTEVQPLIDFASVPTADPAVTSFTWAVPDGVHPRCRIQIDLVTGARHDVIDSTHRYNETAIGGTINRLIDAAYAEDPDCQPPVTTTTTAPTTTSTTPTTTTSTTVEPTTTTTRPAPTTTFQTTPIPPTTAAEVTTTTTEIVVDVPLTPAPTTTAPTPPTVPSSPVVDLYTATSVERAAATGSLPVTGSSWLIPLAGIGALALLIGGFIATLTPARRRIARENAR